MPTFLGTPYAVEWRGNPPHMLGTDIPVWYRFLEIWGHLFEKLYYDCLLGGPLLTPEQEEDRYWQMWRATSSKRADAIAELTDSVWIIEVSQRPGLRAVGQLMVYMALWTEDPKIMKPEKPILVCEHIDTDLIASGAKYGIATYAMPAA